MSDEEEPMEAQSASETHLNFKGGLYPTLDKFKKQDQKNCSSPITRQPISTQYCQSDKVNMPSQKATSGTMGPEVHYAAVFPNYSPTGSNSHNDFSKADMLSSVSTDYTPTHQNLPDKLNNAQGDTKMDTSGQEKSRVTHQNNNATGSNAQDTLGTEGPEASDAAVSQNDHAPSSQISSPPVSSDNTTTHLQKNPNKPPEEDKKDWSSSDHTNPSAPLDTAQFTVKVDWSGEFPTRWNNALQKALQSLCNGTLTNKVGEKCTVHDLKLHNESLCFAEVIISPSKALDTLKEMKKTSVKIKVPVKDSSEKAKDSEQNVTVHFLMEGKKSEKSQNQEATMDAKKGPNSEKALEDEIGTDVGAMKNIPKEAVVSETTDTIAAPQNLPLPVHLYWYLSNVYQKEISKIEKDFRVQISAEVSVSVKALDMTESSECEHRATQSFTDLFQKNTEKVQTITIPQKYLDSNATKQLLFNVQTKEAKMMVNLSAENCQLFGPQSVISLVKKQMNLESPEMHSKMETETSEASRSISRPLEMDVKDTQAELVMDETHWKLLSLAFERHISNIQQKYGVKFIHAEFMGSTRVTATSFENQHVDLGSHALRELTHLYQKVATSAVICSLKNPGKDSLEEVLQKIHTQHPCVGSLENHGIWKLIGLPEHLAPTIEEIEKLTGSGMFDDKTKQDLGDFLQGNNNKWGQHGNGAASWAEEMYLETPMESDSSDLNRKPVKEVKGNAKESFGKGEDDKCPICLDKFTEKKKLKCGHEFCEDCLAESVKSMGKSCPVCKHVFGMLIGTQPKGEMKHNFHSNPLPGFPRCGTIEIIYHIPDGIQTKEHPNPGKMFHGTHRRAYLPNNREGREVLDLLKRAFDQKLIFTVGTSTTTGQDNAVTWNDIHHKTTTHGGPESYGYPDPDYLKRVKEELKAKGIE